MILDNWRGKRVSDGEWVTGSLCMKVNPKGEKGALLSPHIDGELVKYDTIGQCTGMQDKHHEFIYEHDMVLFEDHVYRVERNPKNKELGLLLVFDAVTYPGLSSIALKLSAQAKNKDVLKHPEKYIKPILRADMRKAEILGDVDSVRNRALVVDVSKVEGDKEEYMKSVIKEHVSAKEVKKNE